jgi:hypothetical protein
MLIVVRPASRLALALAGVAAFLTSACTPAAPPVAEKKPRRRSFEESSAYRPSAPAAPQSGTASTDAQAKQVQSTWEQARQATSDAERQRLAGEALKQTRAMAEPQPSGHQ